MNKLYTACILFLFSYTTCYAQPDSEILRMELRCGNVDIQTWPDKAPLHVNQIKKLVEQGFYDGLSFHRVIPGFMAQTGDPTGTGAGGSKLPNIKAEFNDSPFTRGVVGMARKPHPDSANSQFFIMFAPAPHLNGSYTAWGKVVSGMSCVDEIHPGSPPSDPDRINKMYFVNGEAAG